MYSLILILTFILTALLTPIQAQPEVDEMFIFDGGGQQHEGFRDIYAVAGGGFVLCGKADQYWIVRINDQGELMWSSTYEGRHLSSIIETDDGDFVSGGSSANREFSAIRVDPEGEVVWSGEYGNGGCGAVIELKAGNFLLAGAVYDLEDDDASWQGYLLMINGDGDPIWGRDYGGPDSDFFRSMRETDGGVIISGDTQINRRRYYWAVKVNFEGDTLWTRRYEIFDSDRCYSMVSTGDGGFLLGGSSLRGPVEKIVSLVRINSRGEEQWTEAFPGWYREDIKTVIRLSGGGYLSVGGKYWGGGRVKRPVVYRFTADGELIWREQYEFDEDEEFGDEYHGFVSVVEGADNSVWACGTINNSQQFMHGQDGLLMKLSLDHLEPVFLVWVPEDTVFTALRNDETEFMVRAIDEQGDEFGYTWIMGEDTLGHDSTAAVVWDELGEFTVQCQASDGENISSITWHVTVTNFYIDGYQPDSLDMLIHRNTTIDFTISARAVEDDPVEYVWLLNDEQIADDDSVSIRFERGREHSVTAVASQGELADSVTWQVLVNDLVVDYMPEQLELSVEVDTTFEFEVFPFDPNDDSLHFLWTLDGDSISDNSWVLVNFDAEGLYNITAYVSDTTESDSLTWTIDVTPNNVYSGEPQHPDTPTLYPPVPNPFNSTTTVRYYLPTGSQVSLSLFDVNGRLVDTLVHGYRIAGQHSVSVDGSDLVSGVYFIRLNTGGSVENQKLLLLR